MRARRRSPSARNRLGAPFGVGSRIAAVLAEAQALQGRSTVSLANFSVLNLVLPGRGFTLCFRAARVFGVFAVNAAPLRALKGFSEFGNRIGAKCSCRACAGLFDQTDKRKG